MWTLVKHIIFSSRCFTIVIMQKNLYTFFAFEFFGADESEFELVLAQLDDVWPHQDLLVTGFDGISH